MHLSRVALLGNSLGCQGIVELPICHPPRVRSIVLQGLTVNPSVWSVSRLSLRGCFSGRERRWLRWLTIRNDAACSLGRVAETFRRDISHRGA